MVQVWGFTALGFGVYGFRATVLLIKGALLGWLGA